MAVGEILGESFRLRFLDEALDEFELTPGSSTMGSARAVSRERCRP